ncbi:helicase [Nonlabens sp. MB-3u-79]|jgi:superfamily II DNA/RNA helicase|uniref:DEAD/DEAH box helicase n=1 Tax=Nonlabens sp. MB-3u-79 TaxID=2058134 RepID=UPI000C31AB7D|nr:DEAD/DEAH box helicase [Nonlabens sp. MB-3u-79]AUC79723.1 helicase [Nonlabens sp. MB-3u-79]|tara:strand:- start:56718 stop:58034 length:1317 start_codon:yes stop_codon:yes gene_type:complete
MNNSIKSQQQILDKLGIVSLNDMQLQAHEAITNHRDTVIISPTGTGKTLAFLLPVIELLNPELTEVQTLILVPSRELAIQIEQVIREMGTGYKANAIYGGRAGAKDKEDLQHTPTILIGTPGRIADHLRRESFDPSFITTLILDEFDKSLETGFEKEMKEIVGSLPHVGRNILTSATFKVAIPVFVGLKDPQVLKFEKKTDSVLQIKTMASDSKNRFINLEQIIARTDNGNGIIFCNFKDSIEEVSEFLKSRDISHSVFYGGLEQRDRERALIKFRNGTHQLLLATDLAARGIDVPELDFIIHYELPFHKEEFTHRNGRTARMHADGTAYILHNKKHPLPDYIGESTPLEYAERLKVNHQQKWETLFISGGRKDKISKGDIAGLFFKQGNLDKNELGEIELKQDCAFVAVPFEKAYDLTQQLNNSKIKKRKVRIYRLD